MMLLCEQGILASSCSALQAAIAAANSIVHQRVTVFRMMIFMALLLKTRG